MVVIHAIDGRLVRTVRSTFSSKRWYHVIRLADTNLVQRYLIVIDEDFPLEGTDYVIRKENTLRYESSLKACDTYLQRM